MTSRRWRAALLHTDLNAENLLNAEDGRAVLVDWAFIACSTAWWAEYRAGLS